MKFLIIFSAETPSTADLLSRLDHLIEAGSSKFHNVNNTLRSLLYKTGVYVSVPHMFQNYVKETFAQVSEMMKEAETLLENPVVKTALSEDRMEYYRGRKIRREKEIPIMLELMNLRLEMNKLDNTAYDDFLPKVEKFIETCEPVVKEMKALQSSFDVLKKAGKDTHEINWNIINFGGIAVRIDQASITLDGAFKNCKTISNEEYSYMSERLTSIRSGR